MQILCFYIRKGCEHRILVSRGVWEPIPYMNQGATVQGGERRVSVSVLMTFWAEDMLVAPLASTVGHSTPLVSK